MLKRSWVEINLKTIEDNYNIYKAQIGSNQSLMAVIKADAYGHGDRIVAKRLSEIGCRNFAVSNIEEAINVREEAAESNILILGYTPLSSASDLLKYDITQTLLSEEYALALKKELDKEGLDSKKLKAQFAIDTGMNRIGLDGDDPKVCEKIIRKWHELFDLNGIFTHLSSADMPKEREFTSAQIAKFDAVSELVSDLKLKYIHCMNTAGGLLYPKYGNLVRLGISLYGLKPDIDMTLPEGIKPALSWKSVIAMIKTVHEGESIGYGRAFRAEKDMQVATVPTGYADGYRRDFAGGFVLVRGKKAPVLGRICMDQLMIDVTDIKDAAFEDEVCLMGEAYSADELANSAGSIGYEVVCGISKRVPRIYV